MTTSARIKNLIDIITSTVLDFFRTEVLNLLSITKVLVFLISAFNTAIAGINFLILADMRHTNHKRLDVKYENSNFLAMSSLGLHATLFVLEAMILYVHNKDNQSAKSQALIKRGAAYYNNGTIHEIDVFYPLYQVQGILLSIAHALSGYYFNAISWFASLVILGTAFEMSKESQKLQWKIQDKLRENNKTNTTAQQDQCTSGCLNLTPREITLAHSAARRSSLDSFRDIKALQAGSGFDDARYGFSMPGL